MYLWILCPRIGVKNATNMPSGDMWSLKVGGDIGDLIMVTIFLQC